MLDVNMYVPEFERTALQPERRHSSLVIQQVHTRRSIFHSECDQRQCETTAATVPAIATAAVADWCSLLVVVARQNVGAACCDTSRHGIQLIQSYLACVLLIG